MSRYVFCALSRDAELWVNCQKGQHHTSIMYAELQSEVHANRQSNHSFLTAVGFRRPSVREILFSWSSRGVLLEFNSASYLSEGKRVNISGQELLNLATFPPLSPLSHIPAETRRLSYFCTNNTNEVRPFFFFLCGRSFSSSLVGHIEDICFPSVSESGRIIRVALYWTVLV